MNLPYLNQIYLEINFGFLSQTGFCFYWFKRSILTYNLPDEETFRKPSMRRRG